MVEITLVAAVTENNVIGKDNDLVWGHKDDMKHFRDLTMGYPVVMGRKTYESLPRKVRPLPRRLNMVLTRQSDYKDTGAKSPIYVGHTLESLFSAVERKVFEREGIDYSKAMVIGGGAIYQESMSYADALEITHVHQKLEGDTFFPTIEDSIWKAVTRDDREGFSFVRYERR